MNNYNEIENIYLKDFSFKQITNNVNNLINLFGEKDVLSYFIFNINESKNVQLQYLLGLVNMNLSFIDENAKHIIKSLPTEHIEFIFESIHFPQRSQLAKQYLISSLQKYDELKIIVDHDNVFGIEASELEELFYKLNNIITLHYKDEEVQNIFVDILHYVLSQEAVTDNKKVLDFTLYRLQNYLSDKLQNVFFSFFVNSKGTKDDFESIKTIFKFNPFTQSTLERVLQHLNTIKDIDNKTFIIMDLLKNQLFHKNMDILDVEHLSLLFENQNSRNVLKKYENWNLFIQMIPKEHSKYNYLVNIFCKSFLHEFEQLVKLNRYAVLCNEFTIDSFVTYVKEYAHPILKDKINSFILEYNDILLLDKSITVNRTGDLSVLFHFVSNIIGRLIAINNNNEELYIFFKNFITKSDNSIVIEALATQVALLSTSNASNIAEIVINKFLNQENDRFILKKYIPFLKKCDKLLIELSNHSDSEIRFLARKAILSSIPEIDYYGQASLN
jgi:hypothetical protein